MTSKVKNLKGLEKELSISFSLKDMEPTIESKLKELSKNLDLKGFRKGKVPMNVVKSKYYQQCYNESLSEHIEQNYIQVIIDEKLNPVAPPKISIDENKNKEKLFFKALIEVMPEVKIANIEKIKLEKPKLKVKNIDWHRYHQTNPFKESGLALYKWSPIADELKVLDKEIVLNSIKLKWNLVENEFQDLIKNLKFNS